MASHDAEEVGLKPTMEDASMKDGVMAWVVAAAGTMSFALTLGMYRSLGILLVEIMDVFEATTTQASVLFSAYGITYTLTALFISVALGGVVHERALIFMGTSIGFCGFLCTFFATRIDHVTVSQGIGLGVSIQISVTCSFSLITRYFEKRLTVAAGIVTSGMSIGVFAWPVLMRYLLNEYSYRGAALIMGAISLNGFVCAAFMKPFPGTERSRTPARHKVSLAPCTRTKTPENRTGVHCSELSQEIDTMAARSVIYYDHQDFQRTESTRTVNLEVVQCQHGEDQTGCQELARCIKRFALLKQTGTKRKYSIGQLFALTLCKNPVFILSLIFNGFVSLISDGIMQFYPSILHDVGLSDYESAFLLSLTGLAGILGRVITGCLGDYIHNRYKVVIIAQAMLGVAAVLNHFARTFWSQVIYALVIGSIYGVPYGYRTVLIRDLIGNDHMAKMVGFIFFASGVGIVAGGPLIGWLRDLSGGYLLPMYVLGSFCFLNCVILIIMVYLNTLGRRSQGAYDVETI